MLRVEDRSASLKRNAAGRLAARERFRAELLRVEGAAECERQRRYLEVVIALVERRALSRFMYLARAA